MSAGGTLVVGSGFVGTAVARRLAARGDSVTLASRHRPGHLPAVRGVGWHALDATEPEACGRLMARLRPRRVVLVHGPSDVTWCEEHPALAVSAHTAAAAHFAALAGGARLVMISTDNVFDGSRSDNGEDAPVRPANAYGRAKLRAEEIVLGTAANAVVLRVSLVYGHEPARAAKWLNFFAACAHRLLRGETLTVPEDQWTTPVLVDDVAAVTAAVLHAEAPLPAVLHLGGPDRVSRAGWASTVAETLGAPPHLVVPVPRATTRYASRPENACLTSSLLGRLPATRAIAVRGVREGARDLATAFPSLR
ncbi:SDR family oxidoreductase [Streptomyces lancefieldiae]|uniref:Sugar nucleotide-binding protein n=1 Tax=Streptomyces lancefieldiae TaxID=3075520 RepID=A0ABU3ALR2_9ACTN|nr:sugar nucleotide-binding protein [Streptomyces sp. DSM 40712]MDT0611134.1 sugar nucleotide-binding protein [Streptomyces sp. DSM 40712]